MAAKKATPKAEAQPQEQAQTQETNQETMTPPDLGYAAKELADMGFKYKYARSKGQPADLEPIIKAHKVYLNAASKGAHAPDSDVAFVKRHLKHLKSL